MIVVRQKENNYNAVCADPSSYLLSHHSPPLSLSRSSLVYLHPQRVVIWRLFVKRGGDLWTPTSLVRRCDEGEFASKVHAVSFFS